MVGLWNPIGNKSNMGWTNPITNKLSKPAFGFMIHQFEPKP